MNCEKYIMKDIANIYMDDCYNDVTIICEGEEIKVNKTILCARSPVFEAMLMKNDMKEKKNSEIKINDIEKNVLKAMIKYMYKIEVDKQFQKFRELLIVADKYQVDGLKLFCSEKFIEKLNNKNVFDLAIFAETNNATHLLDESVKFIVNNLPKRLIQDWKEKLKNSPKIMQMIIERLIKNLDPNNNIYAVSRGGIFEDRYLWTAQQNAISVEVDKPVKLRGIGLYGNGSNSNHFVVTLKVMDNDSNCCLEEKQEYTSDGTKIPFQLLYSKEIALKPNMKYHIIADFTPRLYGTFFNRDYSNEQYFNKSNPTKVKFGNSPYDTYTGPAKYGQIPNVYFSFE